MTTPLRGPDRSRAGTAAAGILGTAPPPEADDPPCFRDLYLDQVVAAIGAGSAHPVSGFFKVPPGDRDVVQLRQAVFRDLERPAVRAAVDSFCTGMAAMRRAAEAAGAQAYPLPRRRWLLEAAWAYCRALDDLVEGLTAAVPEAPALRRLLARVAGYAGSEAFAALRAEAGGVRERMEGIEYVTRLRGARITVRRYEPAPDYSAEVLAAFDRFRQAAADQDLPGGAARPGPGTNHVEAAVLDMVARLHPDEFAALEEFVARHDHYVDPVVEAFDHQVQFYLAYLDFVGRLRESGLRFCYPDVVGAGEDLHALDAFDVALAARLAAGGGRVVTNSFRLAGPERVLVVSGPNQGGKTTFARMVGQLHFLAGLGCPVPGREARLLLCDRIATHFEREEDPSDLSGKLEDDLMRARPILLSANPSTLVVINEIFTSTTFDDALFLTRELIARVIGTGAVCVIVTFIDEIAGIGPPAVSMVATVDPTDPVCRTYRLVRAPPDGLAYADALLAGHRLDYEGLRARIRS